MAEEVANSACANAHKHLHEVATRHTEEGHVGLASNGFCEERLTSSRRSYKQGTFGNLAAEVGIAFGVLEELHDFLHLELCAFLTSHISESHLVVVVLLEELSAALAHIEDAHRSAAIASSTHSAH